MPWLEFQQPEFYSEIIQFRHKLYACIFRLFLLVSVFMKLQWIILIIFRLDLIWFDFSRTFVPVQLHWLDASLNWHAMKISRIAAKLSSFCDIYSVIKYFMNSFDCSSGIYGIATIQQIKERKHIHRALEAHFSMYLTVKKL